jgi:hypothetical protein
LVPVENIPATTAALETMFFKAASFDPVYIRDYAVKNFSEAAITKKNIEIYEDIVRD